MQKTKTRSLAARAAAIIAGAAALAVLAAACGSSGTANAATPPTGSASAGASPGASASSAVTRDWQAFFAGTTTAARKAGLLQNGQQFAQTLRAQAASPLSKATSVTVTNVTMTSPTTAEVTYSIQQDGQTVLPDQHGIAVLQGGVWKVSAQSFQDLLKLEQGQTGTSPSASP